MNIILTLFALIFSTSVFSEATEFATITHNVLKDKVVKSGTVLIETNNIRTESFNVEIQYSVKTRWYIPSATFDGELNQQLPSEFASEIGYLNLESEGERILDDARLIFKGRASWREFYDCYLVEVIPNHGEWQALIYYHPDVASTGWVKSDITIFEIPVIGTHTLKTEIK